MDWIDWLLALADNPEWTHFWIVFGLATNLPILVWYWLSRKSGPADPTSADFKRMAKRDAYLERVRLDKFVKERRWRDDA